MQQQIEGSSAFAADPDAVTSTHAQRTRRGVVVLAVCVMLLLLVILPPLLSLSRYQRRITTSMAQVLGRPVHLDRVTLNLLPLPSFTLENLVIDESPEFGAEPIIRANSVNARLRIGSLWRHRVEFSRMTFTDPSVNLVHLPDGRWNLEGILLQASRVDAAPTTQAQAGEAPRFPYIEATGARINLKLGQEKTPFSLTDADFALWLPEPRQWKMRIGAKPARTDINVSDTGTIKIEATLERAAALGNVPLTADLAWNDAPLGATSRIVTGADADLRGQLNLTAHIKGELASAHVDLHTQIDSLHRSDFVPEHTVSIDMTCSALATRIFHALEAVNCVWPVPDSKGATIAMTGTVPDLLNLRSAEMQFGTPALPASVLSTWAHVLSARIPADTFATGTLNATMLHAGGSDHGWSGRASLTELGLHGARLHEQPLIVGDLSLQAAPDGTSTSVVLEPLMLPLGGHDPASLEGSADAHGYHLHLSGLIAIPRLLAIAAAVPQIGEGLAEVLPQNRAAGPTRLDLTAFRPWGGTQVWLDTLDHPAILPQLRSRQPHRHHR